MIKKLITIPNKVLRDKSKRIGFIDDSIKRLAEDMIETTLDWDHGSEFGAALAAIQINQPLRLTVVRNSFDNGTDKDFTAFVNPEIVKHSDDTVTDIEGCLSVPGMYGRVKRYKKIKVKALDINNQPVRLTLNGFAARVFQHEIDHMNGKIFLDHIENAEDLLEIDANGKLMPLQSGNKTYDEARTKTA